MPYLLGKFVVADRHGMCGDGKSARAQVKWEVCFIEGCSLHDSVPSRKGNPVKNEYHSQIFIATIVHK